MAMGAHVAAWLNRVDHAMQCVVLASMQGRDDAPAVAAAAVTDGILQMSSREDEEITCGWIECEALRAHSFVVEPLRRSGNVELLSSGIVLQRPQRNRRIFFRAGPLRA